MSHYICGMDKETYKNYIKTENNFKALAELEYSGINEYARLPYMAIMSMEYYHGVSGSGDVIEYSRKDIEQALEELDRVKKLFEELLKHDEKKYLIGWW